MARKKKWKHFFQRFIIFFGFINGLWISIGINPGAEIFNFIRNFLNKINPDGVISLLFNIVFRLLPIIILLFVLYMGYSIFKKARYMGIIAVLFGFMSGILILVSPVIALISLGIAFGLGYMSTKTPKRKKKRKYKKKRY